MSYFKFVLYNMVFAAYFTVGLSGKLDLPFNLIFLAGILTSFLFGGERKKGFFTSRLLGMVFVFIFFLFFFSLDYIFYSGNIILATTHTAILSLILKLFNIRSGRDYFYIFLLSFSIILISTTVVFDIYFFICLLWFIISSIFLTMLFEIRNSAMEMDGSKGEIDYTISGFNRFFEECNLRFSSLFKTGIFSIFIMFFLTIPIFFSMPRFSFRAFDINFGIKSYVSGFSDETEIGDVGKILKSHRVVMRVVVDRDPERIPADLKWRGIALDRFDGKRWFMSHRVFRIIRKNPRDRLFYILRRKSDEDLLKCTFYIEPGISDVIFAPWRPVILNARFKSIIFTNTDTIKSITPIFKKYRYVVFSDIRRPSVGELRRIKKIDRKKVLDTTLEIPGYNKKIYELVKRITKGKKLPVEKVVAVENFLKRNYRYSLNLKPVPDGMDPINFFLFVEKKGHCEYFASSMAILLRYLKIPTRLVNGFKMGSFNPFDNTFIVRELNAHSWVEVYFNQYGWVSFDPTPPSKNVEESSYIVNLVDTIRFFWIKNVINYDFSDQFRLFWNLHMKAIDYRKKFKNFRTNLMDKLAIYLSSRIKLSYKGIKPIFYKKNKFITFIIPLFVFFLFFILVKFRIFRETKEVREATEIVEKVLDKFKRIGYSRKESETLFEFSRRIEDIELRENFLKLANIYYSIRFGKNNDLLKLRECSKDLLKKIKLFKKR